MMLSIDGLKTHIPDAVLDQIPECAEKFAINTSLRLAHFLAQCAHESAEFKAREENLNYSADGLKRSFQNTFLIIWRIVMHASLKKLHHVFMAAEWAMATKPAKMAINTGEEVIFNWPAKIITASLLKLSAMTFWIILIWWLQNILCFLPLGSGMPIRSINWPMKGQAMTWLQK